jgi:hypothetical protein
LRYTKIFKGFFVAQLAAWELFCPPGRRKTGLSCGPANTGAALLLFGFLVGFLAVSQRMDVLLPKENMHAFPQRDKTFAGREFRKNIFK